MPMLPAFDMVLFGGTGDLVMRKLLPALYHQHRDGMLSKDSRVIAVAPNDLSRADFQALAEKQCSEFLGAAYDYPTWQAFSRRVHYLQLDANNRASFNPLQTLLDDAPDKVRVFYLSTSPTLFTPICAHLADARLITPQSRIVPEKPLGHDLQSSREINDAIGEYFSEQQIFRIDHYLGKEPVQNLLALRFGNALFEPLWRREWVRDVQITVAEKLGVEGRGAFYDKIGALRDMLQNHLLQLLCIVAMEPPSSIDPDAVPAYQEEPGIGDSSRTETFVAVKAEIDNWRWAGVPFFLRTGKRMPEKLAEIVINFREVPHSIFDIPAHARHPNKLVIRMQPDESMKLYFLAKTPGDAMSLNQVSLNLDFEEIFKTRRLEAYERLLMDAVRGKLTLFVRRDEQEAAWRWVEPILSTWAVSHDRPKHYTAGSWGPASSSALLSRDGLQWHEEA